MPGATFEYRIRVRFEHCDPANIVFYPRYVGMLAEAVSAWLTDATGWDERYLHQVRGGRLHFARVRCLFRRPSRLGDMLDLGLTLRAIGDHGLHASFTIRCDEEMRLTGELELSYLVLQPEPHPAPLPAELRETLTPALARRAGEGEGAAATPGVLKHSARQRPT